ncbi:MAG: DUF1838 family protein [Gammaproteobacteria bacterium]
MSLANRNPALHLMSRREALRNSAGLALGTAIGLGASTVASSADAASSDAIKFDFSKPEDNLRAWVKLVANLESGKESCGYYKGDVVAVTSPDQKNLPLFGYEGFGMSRVTRLPDGRYENLHREISYYTDLKTGEILESWKNPLTGETVKVYPTNNDPVNSYYATAFKQTFGEVGKQETVEFPFILPWETFGDRTIVTFNVHTRWPSPFTRDKWPREYIGDWYKTSELFQIHCRMSELSDPKLTKTPSTSAWFKEAPYMPWMLMDNAPGRLIYSTRIFSLDSPEQLPGKIYDYTAKNYPKYLQAPDKWQSPNMTTFETWVQQMTPAKPKS